MSGGEGSLQAWWCVLAGTGYLQAWWSACWCRVPTGMVECQVVKDTYRHGGMLAGTGYLQAWWSVRDEGYLQAWWSVRL